METSVDAMQAVGITAFGAPDVLQMVERPMPAWGAGEVLLRVAASGINRPDVLQRKGHYPPPAGASDLPGLEVSGTIVAGDAQAMQAAGWRVGDSVCALLAGGGYASYCVAPVALCLPVPRGLSLVQAATLPETCFTVWSNLVGRAHLQRGETLLIQGGSSGIGVTAIQIAKALGAKVIVTAGTEEKCAACLKLGADHAIHYKTQDFVEEVARITAGRGVDVILDIVAGDYVAREVDSLADDGRLVIIAVQGGTRAALNAAKVLTKRLSITGSTLRARALDFKAAVASELREHVWPLLEAGRIQPVIGGVFAPGQAAEAHRIMENNQHMGKLVLDWQEWMK